MTTDEFRAEMEIELAWRQEEIAFFKNQLNYVTEDKKGKYRKSLVLILYSHFEGYTKICLQTYIQYINSQNLDRRDVNFGLMVAGMNKEFLVYENLDRKCDIFRKELPEDAKLHRLFRRVDFMEELDNFMNQKLHIQDSLIDTESNLWYIVLQKNLYKIGLPVDIFNDVKNDINGLVNRRNSIAHGNFKSGIEEQEFDRWEQKVLEIMGELMRVLYDYAHNHRYLRNSEYEDD